MSAIRQVTSGWRAVCLVAITYVYFLIFAQFAFLKHLDEIGIAESHLSVIMGAMAVGGISVSLLLAFSSPKQSPRLLLQLALLLAGLAAGLTTLPLQLISSIVVALAIGCSLGALTVTLVANLRLWTGEGYELLKVGLGTGLGYYICNVPVLFTATPKVQALTAACLCAMGCGVAAKTRPSATAASELKDRSIAFRGVVLSFTALVWLDSAAFYIIQNTASLKAGTWEGNTHLWANGFLHFGAALLSVFLLRRRSLSFVLCLSVATFAVACVLLQHPEEVVLASLFYPVAVSLYSVALVAFPSLLSSSESPHARARQAGLIYAIAGWLGSAMGIGMGQHLRRVPLTFVAVAAVAILAPAALRTMSRYRREAGVVAAALLVAFCVHMGVRRVQGGTLSSQDLSAKERGRQVYVSEGCINCHSQYVRPDTVDVVMWGPTQTIQQLRSQRPPLIGNRRQGPDLSQVGGRRSPLWLKAHFFDPQEVSHASFMPSYAYLFAGSTRGDDLVEYLASLKSDEYDEHIAMEQAWQPSGSAAAGAKVEDGAHLVGQYCVTCHEATGETRAKWGSKLKRLPPDLQSGAWLRLRPSDNGPDRVLQFARIVKFGIPGTDMPGHEYLSDRDVSSIAAWLSSQKMRP